MKGKQLRKAVLLGMAMSMAVWTTGMAEEIIDNGISGNTYTEKVVDGNLTINNSSKAAAIWASQSGQVFHISAEKAGDEEGNIVLNSNRHGIQTTKNANKDLVFDVSLHAAGSNIIHFNNANGGGIFADKGSFADGGSGLIQLEAVEGGNIIIGEGSATNSSIWYGDGIATNTNTVDINLNGRYNYISAGKNAVHSMGSGDITIQAVKPDSEEGDISTFADYVDYTNVLIGGVNGIQTEADGNTNVIADADNIIAGGTNGILSNGTSTINVEAGNNNNIGQYTDENEQTVTSQTAINASSGMVTVTAGNENVITATNTGIKSDGDGTSVSLSGASNTITVHNDAGAAVTGVDAAGNGSVTIDSSGDFTVNLNTTGTHGYGIRAGSDSEHIGGTVKVTTDDGDIGIDITTGAPDATNGNVDGVSARNSGTVTLDSGRNIVISTHSQVVEKPSNEGNDVSGIRAEGNSSVQVTADGFISIANTDEMAAAYGIHGGKEGSVTVTAKGQNEYGYGVDIYTAGKVNQGVYAQNGNSTVTAENGGIRIVADGMESTNAVYTTASALDSSVTLDGQGDIYLSAHNDGVYLTNSTVAGLYTNAYSGLSAETAVTGKNITIDASSDNNMAYGIYGYASGEGASNHVTVSGNDIQVTAEGGASQTNYGVLAGNSNVDITAQGSTAVSSNGYGLYAWDSTGIDFQLNVTSKGTNSVYGGKQGVVADGALAGVQMTSTSGDNVVQSDTGTGVHTTQGRIDLYAERGVNSIAANTGIWTSSNGLAVLKAKDNQLTTDGFGVYVDTSSTVQLTATTGNNVVSTGTVDEQGFGSGIAVKALSGSQLTFTAENGWNAHLGAIDTRNEGTEVTLDGTVNAVYSAATVTNAGGLQEDKDPNEETSFVGKSVISALYAEGKAHIKADGDWNIFQTKADPTNEDQLERVIWAYDGANIDITGSTYISTDSYSISPNSADIAIAAGTAVNLTDAMVNADVADTDRAHVNLTYGAGSSITGDILAAYAGTVNIDAKEGSDAGISVTGNILAGNNGVLNIDLGKGGYLEGRADDYGDAGLNTTGEENIDQGHATHEFFNPAFSSTIFKGGEVNLTMGEGSRWNVTGQSWVTRINTESAALADEVLAAENPVEAMNHMATIDLVEANTDRNTNAHALTVYEMTGDAVFNMSLDADRDVSDMLYMKSANGDYIINVVDAVTLDDMYAEGFDGLRFATVGEGSNVSFRAVTVGQGVFNVEYEVGTDAYANNDENHAYNGGESVSEDKPGSDLVDGFFESTQEPGTAETQASRKRMRMAAMAMPAAANDGVMLLDDTAAADDTAAVDGSVDETTNFKLIGRKDESTSNAGKTIIAMSKVNYSNAVYMDRLNKRMGEARYIDGDEGLWVRMRHDRIGKSDAFRSKNTMFELGYDRKVGDREDGEHRQGVVFDYMRGTADYHNVAGEGDVRRGGVWFYDTWLGNKGPYTDYVLKFGRLSNDFDIYSELGEKITGDYSNFVYSASAEYGRKKSLGGDWYIEPQAQLQYAHVTDADYTTSQGTSVQLDAIDSLIGRVGFRLGKDVSDTSTFYIKADVLHEFLGDQDISAFDETGLLDTTYENEGTWYDVGLGFSHQFSKGTYMFLDVEKTFGNDNEDTYQFNVGMNWKV